MKNGITPCIPELTIGLDLSDRTARYCELNAAGKNVEEARSSRSSQGATVSFRSADRCASGIGNREPLGVGQRTDYRVRA